VTMLQTCKQASFRSPNRARARHLLLKHDSGPKAKFTEWARYAQMRGVGGQPRSIWEMTI